MLTLYTASLSCDCIKRSCNPNTVVNTMIREWRLTNFKSVASTQVLPFADLTVFTGANSSGKSSVLQSILLVAQTLSSKVSSRAFVLNGELAKLGTFRDVLHDRPNTGAIGIGFTIDLDLHSTSSRGRASDAYLFHPFMHELRSAKGSFEADVELCPTMTDSAAVAEDLQAQLAKGDFRTAISFDATDPDGTEKRKSETSRIRLLRRSKKDANDIWSTIDKGDKTGPMLPDADSLQYEVETDDHQRGLPTYFYSRLGFPEESQDIVGAELEHFLPISLVNRVPSAQRQILRAVADMDDDSPGECARTVSQWMQEPRGTAKRETAEFLLTAVKNVSEDVRDYVRRLLRRRPRRKPDEDTLPLYDVLKEIAAHLDPDLRDKRSLEALPPPFALALLR